MTLVDFVKAREGCSLTAYWDPAGSVWTIGYGSTGPEVVEGTIWTQAQCDASLLAKLTRARQQLLALSPGVAWPVGAQDALTDFVYNEGSGRYQGSTVRKCVEAGIGPGFGLTYLTGNSRAASV